MTHLDTHTRNMLNAVATGAGRRTKALEQLRALAKLNGYESRPGGYIKNIATGNAVAHGWQVFAGRVLAGAVSFKSEQTLTYEIFAALWTATTDAVRESRRGKTAAEYARHENYAPALSWLREAIDEAAGAISARVIAADLAREAADVVDAVVGATPAARYQVRQVRRNSVNRWQVIDRQTGNTGPEYATYQVAADEAARHNHTEAVRLAAPTLADATTVLAERTEIADQDTAAWVGEPGLVAYTEVKLVETPRSAEETAVQAQVYAYAASVDQFSMTGFGAIVSDVHAALGGTSDTWEDALRIARSRVLDGYSEARERGGMPAKDVGRRGGEIVRVYSEADLRTAYLRGFREGEAAADAARDLKLGYNLRPDQTEALKAYDPAFADRLTNGAYEH